MLTPLTPPAGDTILPIADARAALNIIGLDHDARITRARDGAIDWAERYTGIAFLERQYVWAVDVFTAAIRLPRGPVVSVDTIAYRGTDGADAVVADWYLAGDKVLASYGSTWPAGDNVRVTFTAGHATIEAVPPMLMSGMIVAMAAMFADAESPDLTGAQRCLDLVRGTVL